MMNHRERELAAIRHEIPDRIPVDAIAIENAGAIAAHLGIRDEDVAPCLGLDGRLVGIGYTGASRESNRNEWGAVAGEAYSSGQIYPLADASEISHVERYCWPNPNQYDYVKAATDAAKLSAEYAVRGPYWHPLFCRVCSLVGMETAMVWMLLEQDLFEAILEAVFERTYALCEEYVRHCAGHLDILYLGDDFASQRGLLFSPDLWRKYLKPRYARLFEIGKAAGKFVWFHSCGNITEVLPDLIDIGMDVWETVQLHTLPISPENLKLEYGKHITFFGAVSTQRLPFRTTDEVTDEVRRCIDALGKGGGYICGPDHHIKPDVPVENAIALFQTACEYRSSDCTAESTTGQQTDAGDAYSAPAS
jgi:uroporphyrinogen decarboxylase